MHTHTHLFNGQFQDKLGKSGQDNQPQWLLDWFYYSKKWQMW